MNKKVIKDISISALYIALLIVGSYISVPVGYIKFTLQLLVVFVIANTTSLKNGIVILTLYILMGLLGIPVFANFQGGIYYAISPTFGFVVGFYVVIIIIHLLNAKNFIQTVISFVVSLVALYIIGVAYGAFTLNILGDKGYDFHKLMMTFVVPYIPFDLLKIVAAIVVSNRINDYNKRYIHFDSIDSTNTYLKNHYKELRNLTFVSASYQSQGHGRMKRNWQSNKNENLMFSFLIKNPKLINEFSSISLVSGVAVSKVLIKLKLPNVTIKWPNDVYVDDKKICGILMESISNESSLDCLVVGIGINLNTKEFDDELKDKATSYYLLKNKKISILNVKLKIYHQIKKELKHIDDKKYLEFFKEHNYLKDKEAYILLNDEKKLVKILDVNEDNTLKILCDNKEMNINSGEVTFHLN